MTKRWRQQHDKEMGGNMTKRWGKHDKDGRSMTKRWRQHDKEMGGNMTKKWGGNMTKRWGQHDKEMGGQHDKEMVAA